MIMIRQKKKKIIIAALIGVLIGIFPTGIITGIISYKYVSIKKEYQENEQKFKQSTFYILNSDKLKNEEINENDIEEITVYASSELIMPKKEEIVGKLLKQKMLKDIIITENAIYEDESITNDLRMYFFDYIIIPDNINKEDTFDIRISFPNGEDYIVANGKTIESRTEEGAFINATEKELLMISSAYVDTVIYEGAKIYASMYVREYQNLSVINYPVNMYITKLSEWNPNLVRELEENTDKEKRNVLEENLYDFMGVSLGNSYSNGN